MKELIIEENNFHDGIVQQISFDFRKQGIRLNLEQTSENEQPSIVTELIFKAVKWQNIKDFHQFNLIWGIEVSNSFEEFQKR